MAVWLLLGAFNGLAAVAASAYGWHGLGGEEALQRMFEVGFANQMFHGLALLAVAWLATRREDGSRFVVHIAGACFALGIFLFSGTLYWLVLFDRLIVAGAAPAGGVLLMLGWAALMWEGARVLRRRS